MVSRNVGVTVFDIVRGEYNVRISAIILLISITIIVGGCSAALSRAEIQEIVQIELASS